MKHLHDDVARQPLAELEHRNSFAADLGWQCDRGVRGLKKRESFINVHSEYAEGKGDHTSSSTTHRR